MCPKDIESQYAINKLCMVTWISYCSGGRGKSVDTENMDTTAASK